MPRTIYYQDKLGGIMGMEAIENYKACGHVRIIDGTTGETLADKDNMIVETGRDLIADAVFRSTESILLPKFWMFFENDDSDETLPVMIYSKTATSEHNIFSKVLSGSKIFSGTMLTGKPSDIDIKTTTAENVVFFKEGNIVHIYNSVDGSKLSTNPYITALGLLYGTDDGTGTTDNRSLFSRVMFDPVYMRSDRTYIVKYDIKF